MIEYRDHITREMLRDEPRKLFVFGDNLLSRGTRGQAREMRGEPNAVGIPTKRAPSMSSASFLTDTDLELWREASLASIVRLVRARIIVWPSAGIGTGFARLNSTSPLIFRKIEALRLFLE